MRILHAVHNFPPEFEGGTERFVRALAHEQIRRGHRVAILAGSDEAHRGEDVEEQIVDGLEVLRLRRTPGEAYHIDCERPRLAGVVRRLLERERPEILHVHHWQTLPDDLVRTGVAQGARAFVTLHDFFAVCPRFFRISPQENLSCPEDLTRAACIRCARPDVGEPADAIAARFRHRDGSMLAELRAAAGLFAPSLVHARTLERLLPAGIGAIRVVPLGLPERLAGARSRPRRSRSEDEPLRLVTWGNQVWLKGLSVLIEALAALPVPQVVELEVFGTFVEAELERDVRARIAEANLAVRLHGAWTGGIAALASRMGKFDLATFPSLCHESYALVVDEALALGLPLLVSDRGALPERIGGAGVALTAGDVEEWARMLRRLSVDREMLAGLVRALPERVPTTARAAAEYLCYYCEEMPE